MRASLLPAIFAVLVLHSSNAEYVPGLPVNEVAALNEVSLNAALKDTSNPIWFLKFYAPWCGHCKSMAPVLDRVAPQLAGTMAIGKIDCTVEKSLCKTYNVRGYPTLKYSIDGNIMEYSGGRTEEALLSFAKKLSGPVFTSVKNYEQAFEFAATQTDEGVVFVGYDPNGEGTVKETFQNVARRLRASAHFLWIDPGEDERSYPFIHKTEKNLQPNSYENQDRKLSDVTVQSLSAWVQSNNIPLVSELGANNFGRVGRLGRPLALGIVDFDNAKQKKAIKDHILAYASNLPTAEADKYYFGIMDGKKWSKFLSQFNVFEEDNPQMVVMDAPTKTFWQNTTYTNMIDFMKAVQSGDIKQLTATKPKPSGILGHIESLFVENLPYSLIITMLLVFGLVFLLIPSGDDALAPYDRAVDDDGDVIGDDLDDEGAANEPEPETKKEK